MGPTGRGTTLIAAAAALAALGVTQAGPACACSCVGTTDREAFARADAVFSGRLADRDEPWWPVGSGGDRVTLTFEVDHVYKGDVISRQRVVTARSGASCGLEFFGTGPNLVFAQREGAGFDLESGQYEANLCGGTRTIADREVPSSWQGTPPEQSPRQHPSDRWSSGPVALGGLALLGGVTALATRLARRCFPKAAVGRKRGM